MRIRKHARLRPVARTAVAALLAAACATAAAPVSSAAAVAAPATVITPPQATSQFQASDQLYIHAACHVWRRLGWPAVAGWHHYTGYAGDMLTPPDGWIYTGGIYHGYTDKKIPAGLPGGYAFREYDGRGYAQQTAGSRGTARLVRGTPTAGGAARYWYSRDHYDNFREVTDCPAQ